MKLNICLILFFIGLYIVNCQEDSPKDPFKFEVSQEKVDKWKAQAEKSDLIYNENPTGRDSYKSIVKDKFFVKIVSKSSLTQELSSFTGETFVNLNDYSMFIFPKNKDDPSYRGEIMSIGLTELISETDLPAQNVCCDAVDVIYKNDKNLCFNVQGSFTTWTICSLIADQPLLEAFRLQLDLHIIRASNQELQTALIITEPLYEDTDIWGWGDQNQWAHQCKTGTYQSPIMIDVQSVLQKNNFNFEWNYGNSTDKDFFHYYDGRRVVVNGDFGGVKFDMEEGGEISKYDWKASQVVFSFNTEHDFVNCEETENANIVGELQIRHSDEEGNKMVLSFLLEDDPKALFNEFIDQLQAEYMIPQNKGWTNKLNTKPNLNMIYYGGADKFMDKSFYLYSGSETTPPCQEGVIHVVMKSTIKLTAEQLQPLITNSFDQKIHTAGNQREFQPLNNRIIKYYDDQAECPLPEEALAVSQKALKFANVEKDKFSNNGQKKFIVEQTQHTYTSFVKGPTLNDYTFQSKDGLLKVEKVDPSQIDPSDIILLKKGEVLEEQQPVTNEPVQGEEEVEEQEEEEAEENEAPAKNH